MRVFHNIFVLTRSYSDRQRTLKWVLLVTVPRTVLDATASVLTRLGNAAAQLVLRTQPRRKALRTASVRQDQGKYSELFCNGFLRYSGSSLCFLLMCNLRFELLQPFLVILFDNHSPLVAQLHPGLLNDEVGEKGNWKDDQQCPEPEEAVGYITIRDVEQWQETGLEKDEQWQMPDVEAKLNQTYPAQRLPLEHATQSRAAIEDSSNTGTEAKREQEFIQPVPHGQERIQERPSLHFMVEMPHCAENQHHDANTPQPLTVTLPILRKFATRRGILRVDIKETDKHANGKIFSVLAGYTERKEHDDIKL